MAVVTRLDGTERRLDGASKQMNEQTYASKCQYLIEELIVVVRKVTVTKRNQILKLISICLIPSFDSKFLISNLSRDWIKL
jgi:hypothetical protein